MTWLLCLKTLKKKIKIKKVNTEECVCGGEGYNQSIHFASYSVRNLDSTTKMIPTPSDCRNHFLCIPRWEFIFLELWEKCARVRESDDKASSTVPQIHKGRNRCILNLVGWSCSSVLQMTGSEEFTGRFFPKNLLFTYTNFWVQSFQCNLTDTSLLTHLSVAVHVPFATLPIPAGLQ